MGLPEMLLLPCRKELHGSQHCHVGAAVMSQLGAQLASPVCVTVGSTYYLCRLWPRDDACNEYVALDRTVFLSHHTRHSMPPPRSMRLDNIKLLPECTALKSVNLRVVVADHCYTGRLHRSAALRDELHRHVEAILRDVTLYSGYTMACEHLPAATLYGITQLVIITSGPLGKCGVIGEQTRLTISTIVSAARAVDNVPRRLAGLCRPSADLSSFLSHRLQHSKRLSAAGVSPPLAVLLHGPPGCGKTSLVNVVAADHRAHVINTTAGTQARSGDEEQRLRTLFLTTEEMAAEGPVVLFLDDVDTIGGSGREGKRIIAQLVMLLDRMQMADNVAVVAATSCLAAVAPILRRAGRFEKEVFVGMPSMRDREDILAVLTEQLHLSDDVDLARLAAMTPGFVGADLENLTQQSFYTALAVTNNPEQVNNFYAALADANSPEQSTEVCHAHFEAGLHFVVPSSQRGSDCLVERTPTSWQQIGGLEDVKLALKQAVEWPLQHAAAFRRLGLPRPRGVLLYGPPGCAKTTLVRAAAAATHVTFLAVSGAQLYSPCVGDSEKKIAQVFQQARAGAPCILFIDEIDSVVGSRGQGSGLRGVKERVLATLLNEMDGIGLRVDQQSATNKPKVAEGDGTHNTNDARSESVDNRDVLVVAATNRPDMLDAALLRPGRMDRIIYVPMPDEEARRSILEVHMRKGQGVEWKVEVGELAKQTDGFSGADLEALCREAALHALSVEGLDVSTVHQKHLTHVLSTQKPSLTAQQLSKYAPISTFTL